MRGEAGDERLANGAWGKDQDGAIDIRTLLPKDVLHGPFVHEIRCVKYHRLALPENGFFLPTDSTQLHLRY